MSVTKYPKTTKMLKAEHTDRDDVTVHVVTDRDHGGDLHRYEVRCQRCHLVLGPYLCLTDAQWLATNHEKRCPRP